MEVFRGGSENPKSNFRKGLKSQGRIFKPSQIPNPKFNPKSNCQTSQIQNPTFKGFQYPISKFQMSEILNPELPSTTPFIYGEMKKLYFPVFQLQIASNDKIRQFLEKASTWHPDPIGKKIKKFFRLCLHDYGRSQVSFTTRGCSFMLELYINYLYYISSLKFRSIVITGLQIRLFLMTKGKIEPNVFSFSNAEVKCMRVNRLFLLYHYFFIFVRKGVNIWLTYCKAI